VFLQVNSLSEAIVTHLGRQDLTSWKAVHVL